MLPATRQVMDLPLEERRALLEQPGRCFLPIPHYLELSPAVRVELGSPQQPLQARPPIDPLPGRSTRLPLDLALELPA